MEQLTVNTERLREYHPYLRVRVERGGLVLKTLESWHELREALRLRHDIFHLEHHGRVLPTRLDVDEIDEGCDHLGIFDTATDELVGVYRLICSANTATYYARRKFQLAPFLALPGNKLELGRACVRRDYRNGAALTLLWRGILEYARQAQIEYLFGSASIRRTDGTEIGLIHSYCREIGRTSDAYGVELNPEYAFTDLVAASATEIASHQTEISEWIPPLFQSYLKMGARVVAPPAKDTYLHCADFLMVLPTGQLNRRFRDRFGRVS